MIVCKGAWHARLHGRVQSTYCTSVLRMYCMYQILIDAAIKNGTRKLAKTRKPPILQLFELSIQPLDGFKNSKIKSWVRPDAQDHVPKVLN